MALPVSSRFALLMDDDPSDPLSKNTKQKMKKGVSKVKKSEQGPDKNSLAGSNSKKQKSKQGKKISGDADGLKQKFKAEKFSEWDEWKERDTELINGIFENELQEALVQSKLVFQKELQSRQNPTTEKSKKKAAVPLNEFNLMVSSSANGDLKTDPVEVDEDAVLHKLRLETQQELKLAKKREEEKALLLTRNAQFQNDEESRDSSPHNEADQSEKNLVISQMEIDNQHLEEELETCKIRFTKLVAWLGTSQGKTTAELLAEIKKLTESNLQLSKENGDLHEKLRKEYSQLEQERSKTHAEIKKMAQPRRGADSRTNSMNEFS